MIVFYLLIIGAAAGFIATRVMDIENQRAGDHRHRRAGRDHRGVGGPCLIGGAGSGCRVYWRGAWRIAADLALSDLYCEKTLSLFF